MGAKGKNFYNDVARRYGYDDEAAAIQDLYLDGKKDQAAAAVPDELLRAISLIGPRSYVAERMAAFAEAGVTTLNITPLAGTPAERVGLVGAAKELASAL
jgi:DNA-binding MurR/RpiR family transcriptional regulator